MCTKRTPHLFPESGGVVSAPYFLESFGLLNPDGSENKAKSDLVSSTIVSVLQAGAFFGALGSAPITGQLHGSQLDRFLTLFLTAQIGRKYTLVSFSFLFLIGAVSFFDPS